MKTRITLPNQKACYHCITRTVHGERWLDLHGKSAFRQILWRVADFCGVRVLTYCVMSNHAHLLIEVPPMDERNHIEDAELARRYRVLYGDKPLRTPSQPSADEVDAIFSEGGVVAEALREKLQLRMHDLSIFMEMLKNRVSRWYNKTHHTYGTLWAERFSSIIVEGDATALKSVASYIDLNPVRAGLIDDPAKYPFSGYGDAMRGDEKAREGLQKLACYGSKPHRNALNDYILFLYARGSADAGKDKPGTISYSLVKKIFATIQPASKTDTPAASMNTEQRANIEWNSFMVGSADFIQKHLDWLKGCLKRKRAVRRRSDFIPKRLFETD